MNKEERLKCLHEIWSCCDWLQPAQVFGEDLMNMAEECPKQFKLMIQCLHVGRLWIALDDAEYARLAEKTGLTEQECREEMKELLGYQGYYWEMSEFTPEYVEEAQRAGDFNAPIIKEAYEEQQLGKKTYMLASVLYFTGSDNRNRFNYLEAAPLIPEWWRQKEEEWQRKFEEEFKQKEAERKAAQEEESMRKYREFEEKRKNDPNCSWMFADLGISDDFCKFTWTSTDPEEDRSSDDAVDAFLKEMGF